MNQIILDYLNKYYENIEPYNFYRAIFPVGELQAKGDYKKGKYNAIAVEINNKHIKRYTITDELSQLEQLLKSDNFIIVSPISYVGKSRKSENARLLYALAIDLDGIKTIEQITDLFYQIENDIHPTPTYTVFSGNGVHLYYVFENPIPLFKNVVKQLTKLRNELIRGLWNKYVTTEYKNVQYESLFQGFRLVGGVTKDGNRTQAFKTGNVVTLEYLNSFVDDSCKVTDIVYKSELTLAEAKEKYPQWYEQRILQKKPRGTWQVKRALFDWWYENIKENKTVGHRYYCIMCLSIYAKKCGISKEELTEKALSLVKNFDSISKTEDNRFTKYDVLKALEMYNDSYITFPRNSIEHLSNIDIPVNKRNHRKQETHLKIARATLQVLNSVNENNLQGRPTKADIIKDWRKQNPTGTKYQCIKETGISKPTVYKWWDKK